MVGITFPKGIHLAFALPQWLFAQGRGRICTKNLHVGMSGAGTSPLREYTEPSPCGDQGSVGSWLDPIVQACMLLFEVMVDPGVVPPWCRRWPSQQEGVELSAPA